MHELLEDSLAVWDRCSADEGVGSHSVDRVSLVEGDGAVVDCFFKGGGNAGGDRGGHGWRKGVGVRRVGAEG